jgi:predicted nucleotide-binding protein (sugar kinase/HSP70/actin superfamily)
VTAGRATATRPIATFPHMGNYSRVLKELAQLIDVEVQAPPPITRHTLEVGASHSPEFVCVPFKYNLGNFIEALEAGAQVIIQAGGGCRFGYYGEVQETILRDLGYEFDFIAISTAPDVKSILKFLRRYNRYPKKSEVVRVMDLTRAKVRALDEIEQMVRLRVGFEVEPGQHEEVLARFLDALVARPLVGHWPSNRCRINRYPADSAFRAPVVDNARWIPCIKVRIIPDNIPCS